MKVEEAGPNGVRVLLAVESGEHREASLPEGLDVSVDVYPSYAIHW